MASVAKRPKRESAVLQPVALLTPVPAAAPMTSRFEYPGPPTESSSEAHDDITLHLAEVTINTAGKIDIFWPGADDAKLRG